MLRAWLARPVDRYAGAFVAIAVGLFAVQPAGAVERIGNAIQIVRTVTGEIQANFRYLILEDPVFQNEVIATKPGSASRIIFRDRSELQVGPEARVTLDSFVFDPDPSLARFFISAFDGVLRFATGKLAKTAYQIETPTAIIGVRGTTFASIFGPAGEQVILLEEGVAVTVQDRNGGPLRTLTQPGLSLTVSSDGSVSGPQPPPQWAIDKLRELTALLFTLDEIQRGDQFDDDEEPPVEPPPPVQQEAAAPPPPPARPAALAKDHGKYRSDIRIERRRPTIVVHRERDKADRPADNRLQATSLTPKARRPDFEEDDRGERTTAQNKQNRPSADDQRPEPAASHVSTTASVRDTDRPNNRNDGNERGSPGHNYDSSGKSQISRDDSTSGGDWGDNDHGGRDRANDRRRR